MTDKNKIIVIAGMPRASTTFLYFTLSKHPDVYVPARKESDFFTSLNHFRGADWYFSLFKDMKNEIAGFDVSPHYFMDKNTPEMIQEFNPDAKVILMVRNPSDWFISFYFHLKKTFFQKINFPELLKEGFLFKKETQTLQYNFSPGYIKKQIERYRKTFGHNLLICSYNVTKKDPLPLLKSIEQFTGLSGYFNRNNFEDKRVMTSTRKPIRPINFLKRQKLFVDFVQRVFPHNLVFYIQKQIIYLTNNTASDYQKELPAKYIRMAEEHFEEDAIYVNELFKDAGIITGKGEVFDQTETNFMREF